MKTKVYGCSDDLIEFEGGFKGEVDAYGTDDSEKGVLIILSDKTILEVKYGKHDKGIWEIKLVQKGELFECIEPCTDEDAEIYSDIAYFKEGIKWGYAAKEWEIIK